VAVVNHNPKHPCQTVLVTTTDMPAGVQHEMKRRLYAPAVILLGLLSAQLIATIHVYLSNRNLLQTTEALLQAQYLSVPNARVAAHLDTLTTAMAGGLLFTLSIGAGLAMLALAGVWVWDRVFQRSRKAALIMLLVWAGGIFLVNGNGWNPAASAYLAGVPLVSAMAALALLPAPTPMISASRVWWPVSAALILALLWGLVLDRHLFTHIRDHLLLGSPVGQSITNAYYAYTLFPAETFKSLAQKQIRTCTLDASLDRTTGFAWSSSCAPMTVCPCRPARQPTCSSVGTPRQSNFICAPTGERF
jgi:hypothetical protein